MLRRALELRHFHVPGTELDWDLRPLLEKADAIETVHRLTWRDWNRFSNRQQRKITLGGFAGEMTLQGDLGPFEALLRTAEICWEPRDSGGLTAQSRCYVAYVQQQYRALRSTREPLPTQTALSESQNPALFGSR